MPKFLQDEETIALKKQTHEFARIINPKIYTDEQIEEIKKECIAARTQFKHTFSCEKPEQDEMVPIIKKLSAKMHRRNPNPSRWGVRATQEVMDGKLEVRMDFQRMR